MAFFRDSAEGIVSETLSHRDILKDGDFILFPEFLHTANSENLGVHLKEWMFVVDEAVRMSGSPPEIELDLKGQYFFCKGPLVGKDKGIDFNFGNGVLR